MDFKPLQTSNFDVNSWVRQMFENLPENADLEKVFQRFSSELDVEINKTTAQIKNLSQQVVVSVPRISREFEQTHKEVNKLQDEVTAGFNQAENVQKKTTASMTMLEKLDNVKTNLLQTSAALHEADKWSGLSKLIEQLLDNGDVHQSYECIIGMEKSLAVLDQSTSEERTLILEEVKNRLEALATKHIIEAFENNDIENASRFFVMFSKLERTAQYIKYFENSEKIKLTQEWRNYVELLSFKDAITKFYDDLIDHLRLKVQWCKIIFTENSDEFALNVLLGLYTETIKMLEPSIQYCFDVESKKEPFLELLLQFNQITHRFVQNLRQFIESGCNAKPKPNIVLDLVKVVFAPFIPQYVKYSKYHEKIVIAKLQEAITQSQSVGSNVSNVDISALLQERIDCAKRLLPEIILGIKEGEEKILLLNHGYGYYHFGRGINAGLEKFREWCFLEVYKILELTTGNPDKQRSLLENSLSFGEVMGEILQQVIQLDNSMTSNCSRVISKLNSTVVKDCSEWEAYSLIYLDDSLLHEVTQFFQKKETLLASVIQQLKKLCKDTTQLILKVTATPIETQLKKNFVLSDCNLKEAIPSEYITQVGEYLMLLPQNLDPYITSEASSLAYTFDQQTGEEDTKSPVDYILSNISVRICEAYSERLLKITYLSEGQSKTAIGYLSSVLEDLGGKITADLVDFSKLMKMYNSIDATTSVDKVSSRILGIVKMMRNGPLQ